MIVISILFYFGIAILLTSGGILKYLRLVEIYQISGFKKKEFLKNLIKVFNPLEYFILLALFITFIFNEKKETSLTLLCLVLLGLFYLGIMLRFAKRKVKIKSASSVNYFIFAISLVIYLILFMIFTYFFNYRSLILAPFTYSYFISYIFIIRSFFDKTYFKLRERRYKKNILLMNVKNKNIYFIVGKNSAKSFKNVLYLFLEKHEKKLKKNEDIFLTSSCFYENCYLTMLAKTSFIYVPDISLLKPFFLKKGLNYFIFKENSKDFFNEKKGINILGNMFYPKDYDKKDNYEFRLKYIKNSLTEIKSILYLNDKEIKKYKSDIYFSLNQEIIGSIYALLYLENKNYYDVLNTNLFENFTIQKEDDTYLISFKNLPNLSLFSNYLSEIDNYNYKKVAYISLSKFTSLTNQEIKNMGKYLSNNFDGISLYSKEYEKRILSSFIDNKRLQKVYVAKYKEDAKMKAYQFFKRKPYIIVNIINEKE